MHFFKGYFNSRNTQGLEVGLFSIKFCGHYLFSDNFGLIKSIFQLIAYHMNRHLTKTGSRLIRYFCVKYEIIT